MKVFAASLLQSTSLQGSSSALRLDNQRTTRSSGGEEATSSEVSQRLTAGASLQASQATSASRIAQNATSEILSLRKQQQTLVEEAQISNDPERRSLLQTEIDTLDTEIQRVRDEAVDRNGNQVLNGQTFVIEGNDVVSLANLSSIAASSGVDVSTADGADAAAVSFEDIISSANAANTASTAAATKAEGVLAEITSIESEARSSGSALASVDDAARLSETIAQEIQGLTSQAEFSNLRAENVLGLLQ
ncbi:hypothetical protein MRY87_00450 [bacterium]|nr:hypothetical protein [bacterium]